MPPKSSKGKDAAPVVVEEKNFVVSIKVIADEGFQCRGASITDPPLGPLPGVRVGLFSTWLSCSTLTEVGRSTCYDLHFVSANVFEFEYGLGVRKPVHPVGPAGGSASRRSGPARNCCSSVSTTINFTRIQLQRSQRQRKGRLRAFADCGGGGAGGLPLPARDIRGAVLHPSSC